MALDPISAGLDLANTVVKTIWPDKSQEERDQLAAALALVQGQMDINKAEAGSASVFVAGARPFIMWICGVGLAMQFIVSPLLQWGAAMFGKTVILPPLDMGTLLTLLLGMLGLGSMRTVERIKGVIPPGR
jgi:hypothetical protein